MKILFITSLLGAEYGGAEVSTRLLLESLREHGQEVQALTTRKHPKDPTLISISLPIEVPKKLVTLGNNQIDYFLAKKIRLQLERIQPDVIHIQDTYILSSTVAANRKLKIPSVATIRNSVLDETWHMMFPRPFSTMLSWRNKTIIKALHSVDCVISVSKYIKSELVQRGIASEKIVPIYNLPPTFKVPSSTQRIEDDQTLRLFAPGQLETFKGFHTLIKAMKTVSQANPNVHLVIAGGGSQTKKLHQLTCKLYLERWVEFVGKIPFAGIAQYYSDCDIVVFPSIYAEPFGRVALEAMYFSKPVIASRVGGIPEIVENGKNGLLVPPADPSSLAQTILNLCADTNQRITMGQQGNREIPKKFDPEAIIFENQIIYKKIIKQRK